MLTGFRLQPYILQTWVVLIFSCNSNKGISASSKLSHCVCRETPYMLYFRKSEVVNCLLLTRVNSFYEQAIIVKPELASYLLLHSVNRWLICSVWHVFIQPACCSMSIQTFHYHQIWQHRSKDRKINHRKRASFLSWMMKAHIHKCAAA